MNKIIGSSNGQRRPLSGLSEWFINNLKFAAIG